MLEKIKTIPLTNLIIIGLLCYILFDGMFNPKTIVPTNTTVHEQQITNISKQLETIKAQNIQSEKKIDSLRILATKSSVKINYLLQTQLQNDKSTLNKMSDDENVIYFHDYINAYKTYSSDNK